MVDFNKQFPEFKIADHREDDGYDWIKKSKVKKYCLSRKRVLEAIEKVEKGILTTSYICDSHERKTVSVAYLNILKKELGLDKEE